MINRLVQFDLVRRFDSPVTRTLVELAVASVSVALAFGLRLVLEEIDQGIVPFALLFPAILIATLVAGWRSGLLALMLGGGLTWSMVIEPRGSFELKTPHDALNVALYVIAAAMIVALAGAFRSAAQRLAESGSRLRLAIDAGRMAVWEAEAPGRVIGSPELNRLLGFPPEATPSLDEVNAGYLPGELDRVREIARAATQAGEQFFEAEYRYRWPNGAVRWLLLRAEMQTDTAGTPVRARGVVLDVTDRKLAEERLRLLAREVDHRANNLMAVVQSTVALSRAADVTALKGVITGRVDAIARAHQLLSATRWEGADLKRLVHEELEGFALGEAGRVEIEGEPVSLGPAAAQGVAMALHELATNAVKYGGLSRRDGHVRVGWRVTDDRRLVLRWEEHGGPVVSPPTTRGLGSTILQRALDGAIGGETRVDWRPEGLVCELDLPLNGDVSGPAAA